jgi:hypothetical protein
MPNERPMPASDPVLEALRLLLRRAPRSDRAHLDNLIALYEHSAAEYAVLRDALAAMPATEDSEDDLRRNARAVLSAEHQRFVYLAANARAFRAGLPT